MSSFLREWVQADRALRVDRKNGVIRGVKLLGWSSRNGRKYDPNGVDPSLYESKPVNFNHVTNGSGRSVTDRIGRIVNATKRSDGVYGDIEYLKSHPMAGVLAEAAERMPSVFGMSHAARGRSRRTAGGEIIEQIESVESCDVVSESASTNSLFEEWTMPRSDDHVLEDRAARVAWLNEPEVKPRKHIASLIGGSGVLVLLRSKQVQEQIARRAAATKSTVPTDRKARAKWLNS